MTQKNKKVAVILCGSGFRDGSEIRESVGVLWALSQHSAEVQCFALNEAQRDVVNCFTSDNMNNETRNQLIEAARIARGKIKPLEELQANEFDALLVPGGYGAAKNLCDFALKGAGGSVHPVVGNVLTDFHKKNKPIGAVCIAPAILALHFKGQDFELTLGAKSETSAEVEKLGHRHVVCEADQCHVDKKSKIVTTPAYMYDDASLHSIFKGIQGLVDEVLRLT